MPEEITRLLECPFCVEHKAGVRLIKYKGLSSDIFRKPEFYVVCQDCKLNSPSFSTAAKAIAYWNTRRKNGITHRKIPLYQYVLNVVKGFKYVSR